MSPKKSIAVKKLSSQAVTMQSWGDLFGVAKHGGVIPVGDYFVVVTPKNGFITTELYVSMKQEYDRFTPSVREPKVKKTVKAAPVRVSVVNEGGADLFG
jgi:hypothetical protein